MPYSVAFLRKLADSSRYYFTRIIGSSAGSGGDISPDLHKIVLDILDKRKLKRHGQLFPRYWRKTTAFTVLGSIYDYLHNPEERQLIVSETLDLASGILFLIQKHLLFNVMLRKLYPDKLALINEEWRQRYKWNETTIELPRSGIYRDYSFKAMGATAAKQGGHFCLAAGSLVYTSNGLIPIENIHPHMRVLNKNGKHTEVLGVFAKKPHTEMITLNGTGMFQPLVCTQDHQILIYRKGTIDWKKAQECKRGDYFVLPLPTGYTRAISRTNKRINTLLENPKIWRLIGYWLAEGCATDRKNRIRLCFGSTELDLVNDCTHIVSEVLGVPVSGRTTRGSTIIVNFSDKDMKEILLKFGTHSYNKHIPPIILSNRPYLQKELIIGYFKGDGYKNKLGNGWSATTASISLAAGIQLLLGKLGIPSGINRGMHPGYHRVYKNICYTKGSWIVYSNHPLMNVLMGKWAIFSPAPCQIKVIPGYILFPVKSIKKSPYQGMVYDISVRHEESFVSQGICVHNSKIRIDDLIGDAARESPVIMKKACLFIDGIQELLAEPNRHHPDASEIEINGTHYAPADAYVYIQENYPEYEWFVVPALKNTELKDTPNIHYVQNPKVGHNESNWPDKYPTEHYEEMKSGEEKSIIFWTQHQNDPNKATQLTKFEASWIRWYHLEEDEEDVMWVVCEQNDGKDGEKFRLKDIKQYGMIDPAGFKELKMITKGARNVLLIGGQPDNSKKKFVTFTWCGRPKEPETVVNEVFAAHKKWTPRLWKIDSTGNDMLAIIKNACRVRGHYLPVSSLSVDVRADSKDIDILALVDPMHNGEIWLHHSMKELIGEIKGYPGALTKDLLDMLAKLNRYFWTRRTRDELKKLNKDTSSIFGEDGRSKTTGY